MARSRPHTIVVRISTHVTRPLDRATYQVILASMPQLPLVVVCVVVAALDVELDELSSSTAVVLDVLPDVVAVVALVVPSPLDVVADSRSSPWWRPGWSTTMRQGNHRAAEAEEAW